MNHIQARQTGLIASPAGQDMIVYDEASAALHTLNPLAAFVWHLADGQTAPATMLTRAQTTIDPQATLETQVATSSSGR